MAIVIVVSVILPYLGYKDYEDYSPRITHLGSACMLISFLSLIIATYPIYKAWSLLIVPILCFGFMMLAHFIPFDGKLNTFIIFTAFGLLCWHFYHPEIGN